MAENAPNLWMWKNIWVQEAKKILDKMKQMRSTPKNVIKMLKIKAKGKKSKHSKRKNQPIVQGNHHQTISWVFFSRNFTGQKTERKKLQSRIHYKARLSHRVEWKTEFPGQAKPRGVHYYLTRLKRNVKGTSVSCNKRL